MALGVAWIAFVLVKAIPVLLGLYGAAGLMKRRADLLKASDARPLSDSELQAIGDLTAQVRALARNAKAGRMLERESELCSLAKLAAARGDWRAAREALAGIRRSWT